MLQKFSDEQLAHVQKIIDPPFWVSKFKKLPADATFVKEVVKESNI